MSTCDRQWLTKWLPTCEWVHSIQKRQFFLGWTKTMYSDEGKKDLRGPRAVGLGSDFRLLKGHWESWNGQNTDHPPGASWVWDKYYVALPLHQLLACHGGIWSYFREDCGFSTKGRRKQKVVIIIMRIQNLLYWLGEVAGEVWGLTLPVLADRAWRSQSRKLSRASNGLPPQLCTLCFKLCTTNIEVLSEAYMAF